MVKRVSFCPHWSPRKNLLTVQFHIVNINISIWRTVKSDSPFGKSFLYVRFQSSLPSLILCIGAAGQNKQHSITKNTAKLDRETEELHHDRVTLEVGKVIQQGRQSKGLTQKDLATKINEKPQVIADYECGRAIPNNQVLGKIERAIGLKLRGKDIGKPLETGPKGK
uniref:Endothelial differentiation-related factor 1 n=1 Tax=Monodelphis domestica TaxID=13616 RepID=A0A5F8GUL5_MONDO